MADYEQHHYDKQLLKQAGNCFYQSLLIVVSLNAYRISNLGLQFGYNAISYPEQI